MNDLQRLKIATAKLREALECLTELNQGGELERINQTIATIKTERGKKVGNKFDDGFDCGTQLALDLLGEWKEYLGDE